MKNTKTGIISIAYLGLILVGILIGIFNFLKYLSNDDFHIFETVRFPHFLFMIISVGLILSFKIVKINAQGAYSFHPFLFRKKEILWKNMIDSTWEFKDSTRGIGFRKVSLKTEKIKISLLSSEFANFDSLINQIPNAIHLQKEMNIAYATNSKGAIIFLIILFSLGIIEESYLYFTKDYLRDNGLVLGICLTLLFTSIKNLVWCMKVMAYKNKH